MFARSRSQAISIFMLCMITYARYSRYHEYKIRINHHRSIQNKRADRTTWQDAEITKQISRMSQRIRKLRDSFLTDCTITRLIFKLCRVKLCNMSTDSARLASINFYYATNRSDPQEKNTWRSQAPSGLLRRRTHTGDHFGPLNKS